MNIQIKTVLKGVSTNSPLRGLHRVLWIDRNQSIGNELLVTIAIPARAKDDPPIRYWKSPERHSLAEILDAIEQSTVVVEKLILPPIVYMTDDQIRRRYPQRTTPTRRRQRTDCALLQTRDRLWALVEPLVSHVEEHPEEMYRSGAIWQIVKVRASQTQRSRSEVQNALNRCLALSCGKNSLLPATPLCGAVGRSRSPKTAVRLGKKNAAFQKGLIASPGIHLTDEDKYRINLGWRTFLCHGRSVRAAHILTLGAWWSDQTKFEYGMELPVLRRPEECPTLRQFRYWGPRQEQGRSAFELLLRPNEWNKKYRPLLGTALDGINAVGQVGLMDSTSTDQTLVSMISELDAVGTCNRNVIHDGLSDVICGLYCGFEAPSPLTAMLTILNTASDKVEFCRRFEIDITPEQFPSLLFRQFRIDNGEMRAQTIIEQMKSLGSGLEFVERDRPERKGPVEAGHRTIHRLLDQRGDGRTNGRQRQRGEDHSAIKACWTWYVYVRELLLAIIYYNNNADASALYDKHPFRTEMLRADVPPNRAAIYKWCVQHGRISAPYCDFELLRAMLLPETKAVVERNGVFLLRQDRGAKIELLRSARFSGPRAAELRWHEGTSKPIYIDVRYDPNDLTCIWYPDELGFHRLSNLSLDPTIKRQGTFADYVVAQDRQHVQKLLAQPKHDQMYSDIVSHIESTNLGRRAIKQRKIDTAKEPISKSELSANIRENRAREIRLMSESIDPVARTPIERSAQSEAQAEAQKKDCSTATSTSQSENVIDAALATFRGKRGAK
jgi:putative transposase